MRVLILGGTGFIGPSVVRRLYERGHELTLFHRGQHEIETPAEVRHIHCDPTRQPVEALPEYRETLRELAPDVVLYMVPWSDRDSRILVETIRGIARRVVGISSQDVYRAYGRLHGTEPGPIEPVPLTEDSPLREKLYPYRDPNSKQTEYPLFDMGAYDKILAERVLMGASELAGTILRLPMVYGERDTQHRLYLHLKRMDDQRPAILLDKGLARWHWTRGYVENVAEAIALAVTSDQAAGRIYNVGEPFTLSFADWIQTLAKVVGWQGDIVTFPRESMPPQLLFPVNTDQDIVTDTSRIRVELGYQEPVGLDEALRRTVAWERANPPQGLDPRLFDYKAEDELLRSRH
ncbi:nucleoside-diphosphate-sugar epimerase [Thermosporothrix hazakensis]|jgi:nucleoside-diphosphate-sugar epimerase|uniref:Nucleoside-diphosphate-sugar epimerase n=2 Tax=Thermosporothrix TaxID=768650 RepID=A0A326U578_THEHA|nr:NAD-dependent epimerase/dehydratase family protein [Thermosporothrix hazakensis]PZW27441.1 nucleoside-diphosphate-sugar epimerase [Thermosporothrix hazakensis]BBH85967.1 oxidoreductase [Thermosporothrix sp. COM3]GCE45608.1 oxidoreductase [Thermosporothrix hazakensis]